jgi:hypothetical protein
MSLKSEYAVPVKENDAPDIVPPKAVVPVSALNDVVTK